MKIKMLVKGGRGSQTPGRTVTLTKVENTIGRKDADIVLADAKSSAKHAVLYIDSEGKLILRDLGSTNGTFINGKRIVSSPVEVGDKIVIGASCLYLLEFVVLDEKSEDRKPEGLLASWPENLLCQPKSVQSNFASYFHPNDWSRLKGSN